MTTTKQKLQAMRTQVLALEKQAALENQAHVTDLGKIFAQMLNTTPGLAMTDAVQAAIGKLPKRVQKSALAALESAIENDRLATKSAPTNSDKG